MKFFALISLFAALLLGVTIHNGLQKTPAVTRKVPEFLRAYKARIKESFKKPENANLLFSFITGDKNGISPYTKKSFKKVNLLFLLSPSGVHLAGILLVTGWLIKKNKNIKTRKALRFFIGGSGFYFTDFYSIKRLGILRLFSQFKLRSEIIFILTFCVSFILGDFFKSPLSFIYSFIFIGTFLSLKDHSKSILILGLFSTQLVLALFMGEKVSLLSIPCGLFGSFIFSFLFPVFLIFLGTFWFFPVNWVEPFIRGYVVSVNHVAGYLNGSFTSSSVFLIAFIWILMMMKSSVRKCALAGILLFLHTNTAMTPVQFT